VGVGARRFRFTVAGITLSPIRVPILPDLSNLDESVRQQTLDLIADDPRRHVLHFKARDDRAR